MAQAFILFKQALFHLLWPARCVLCDCAVADSNEGLCDSCWNHVIESCSGTYCSRCGRDVSEYAQTTAGCGACLSESFYFDAIARTGRYDKSFRNLILSFKHGREEHAHRLAELMYASLQGSGFENDIELFVPVPLHWRRKLLRGFNQSYLIARTFLKRNQISTDIVRTKNTKLQPMMASAAGRKRNVKDAFAIRRGHPFEGKTICLIDDIKTTGATLNECAKILKAAGAKKVYALVLGVAGQNG